MLSYIESQHVAFQQHAGAELWSKFERQGEALEAAAPSLTRNEIERLEMQRSQVLNPFGVEQLYTPYEFKTTTQFNEDLLLSNPDISKMHRLRQIEAYGQRHNETRNVAIWNRLNSGMILPDAEGKLVHSEYGDDAQVFSKYNDLSAMERRVAIHNTQRAVKLTMDEVDFSSIFSGGL